MNGRLAQGAGILRRSAYACMDGLRKRETGHGIRPRYLLARMPNPNLTAHTAAGLQPSANGAINPTSACQRLGGASQQR